MSTKAFAQQINTFFSQKESMENIKDRLALSPDVWMSSCLKAYALNLSNAKEERSREEKRPHVLVTSNKDILELIKMNEELCKYALLLPIFSTMGEFKAVKELMPQLPGSESQILNLIGRINMHPKFRILQKLGRIKEFNHFKVFTKVVDAAVLSYYRTNFISCYLTLLPVIEGVIIRWMGYSETGPKPEFENIRKFFKRSALRNPNPTNILFHNIYVNACDNILNKHFYKPTDRGTSHANFNRHVASHLLNDNQFATKENCIRLFILLDAMTELYWYESGENDPRFSLGAEQMANDLSLYSQVFLESSQKTVENQIFGTSPEDLLYRNI